MLPNSTDLLIQLLNTAAKLYWSSEPTAKYRQKYFDDYCWTLQAELILFDHGNFVKYADNENYRQYKTTMD